jgi:hypothetical protein
VARISTTRMVLPLNSLVLLKSNRGLVFYHCFQYYHWLLLLG